MVNPQRLSIATVRKYVGEAQHFRTGVVRFTRETREHSAEGTIADCALPMNGPQPTATVVSQINRGRLLMNVAAIAVNLIACLVCLPFGVTELARRQSGRLARQGIIWSKDDGWLRQSLLKVAGGLIAGTVAISIAFGSSAMDLLVIALSVCYLLAALRGWQAARR